MEQGLKRDLSDGLELIVARDFGEVKAIRPIWEEMQSNQSYPAINADIDRYLSVLESQKEQDIRPHVILLQRRNIPEVMVIGRVERRQLHCRIGYKDIFKPFVQCLTVVYGGFLGDQNERNCDAIMKELLSTLRRGEVDIVLMKQLRTDSMIYRLAKRRSSFLCRGHFTRVDPHWLMSIPKSIDDFLQARSARHRGNLRRYVRKLNKEYDGQVKVVTSMPKDPMDIAVTAIAEISRNTYQANLGVGFIDSPGTRKLLNVAARKGWLRMDILYVAEQPCAFQIGLLYGDTYFSEQIGFDPKWRRHRVGTVLFMNVIEDLCKDSAVEYYDFGFGDAEYKEHYAETKWTEAAICIFASRFRPVCLNLLFSSVAGMSLGLNYLTDKAGFARWLKRRWRNHLQGKKE